MIDVGDHAGVDLHALLNEDFPGDQSAIRHLVGEDVPEASTATASAAVAESESTLSSSQAIGGSILEELPEGQPIGRQIDQQISREDDRLIGQDDRARGPRVVGVIEEQAFDFTVNGRGANLRLKKRCRSNQRQNCGECNDIEFALRDAHGSHESDLLTEILCSLPLEIQRACVSSRSAPSAKRDLLCWTGSALSTVP